MLDMAKSKVQKTSNMHNDSQLEVYENTVFSTPLMTSKTYVSSFLILLKISFSFLLVLCNCTTVNYRL